MTLIEVILVAAITTLLIGGIFTSVQILYRQDGYSSAQSNEVENARRAISRFGHDVREMTYAEDGSFPIVAMEPHLISFYSDVDRDNSVELVTYRLATTTLYKYVYNATGQPPVYDAIADESNVLSLFVQNLNQGTSTFMYYDENGTALSTSSLLTDVRYIETRVIVNIDPIRDPGEFMLKVGVTPRNLKDNL
jgi:type II secretory pathway component PulJ